MRKTKKVIFIILFLLIISLVYSKEETTIFNFNETFDSLTLVQSERLLPYVLYDLRQITPSFENYSNFKTQNSDYGLVRWGRSGQVVSGLREWHINSNWSFYDKQFSLKEDNRNGFKPVSLLIFEFENPITLTNESFFGIITNSTNGNTSWLSVIFKKNNSADCSVIYRLGNSGQLDNEIYMCDSSTVTVTTNVTLSNNFNIGSLTPNAIFVNFSGLNDTDYLADYMILSFINSLDVGTVLFIDNVFLGNVTTTLGDNDLPFFNVTLNETIFCINDTVRTIDLGYNITYSDSEDDTLLLGTSFKWSILDETVFFNRESCILGFCSNSPNYDFVNNLIFPNTDTCGLNIDNDNITAIQNNFNVLLFNSVYYLSLKGELCTLDNQALYYKSTTLQEQLQFKSEVLFTNAVSNESFNITFFDETLTQKYLQMRFVENGSNIDIYHINSTNETLINTTVGIEGFNFTISNFFGEIRPNLFKFNINRNEFINLSLFDSDSRNTLISIIVVAITEDTDLRIRNFEFDGLSFVPVFNETITGFVTMTLENIGVRNIVFYITDDDDEHLPLNIYSTETKSISVVRCDTFTSSVEGSETGVALSTLKDALNNVCTLLDDSFKIGSFDASRYGFCFFLIVIWFIISAVISAGFSVMMLLMKRTLAFPSFIMMFSIFGLFGNAVVNIGFVLNVILSIGLAIGGVSFLRIMFITGEVGEGGA